MKLIDPVDEKNILSAPQINWMSSSFQTSLVSVIVPTFNRANFILESLASVKQQSYRPIEVIVVDDGSTDDTVSIVSEWIKENTEEDFKIYYIYQNNQGSPIARNKGLSKSHGEFIQFLDSDDILHPQKLEIHAEVLINYSESDYVWSNHNEFEEYFIKEFYQTYHTQTLIDKSKESIFRIKDELMSIPGNVWSGLYRRNAIIKVGPWNPELIRWQDVEFNFRFANTHPLCIYVDAILYSMRIHSQGRIQDLYKHEKGISGGFQTLQSIQKVIGGKDIKDFTVRRNIANFYLGLGYQAMKFGTREQVFLALDDAKTIRKEITFTAKVKIIQAFYCLLGGDFSRYILNVYRTAMSIFR
ncbi:MAG: glycosyltransferase family A protein [Calothrix sp. MO_167.B42]|nr:glycosyltransferase family A protein [Calothrix sp. MO_167.B42]